MLRIVPASPIKGSDNIHQKKYCFTLCNLLLPSSAIKNFTRHVHNKNDRNSMFFKSLMSSLKDPCHQKEHPGLEQSGQTKIASPEVHSACAHLMQLEHWIHNSFGREFENGSPQIKHSLSSSSRSTDGRAFSFFAFGVFFMAFFLVFSFFSGIFLFSLSCSMFLIGELVRRVALSDFLFLEYDNFGTTEREWIRSLVVSERIRDKYVKDWINDIDSRLDPNDSHLPCIPTDVSSLFSATRLESSPAKEHFYLILLNIHVKFKC